MTSSKGESDQELSASGRIDEIRRSAGSLFLAKGYASTTMNDIASSVGILPGSLYHHFVSKEAVAIEMLDSLNDDLRLLSIDLRRLGYLALPPEARLRELCRRVVQLSLQHAAAVRLRAFDPPTVASDRFRDAVALQPVGLQRLWRAAANDLRDRYPHSPVNPYLLTHTLQRLTATSSTSLPGPVDPDVSSRIICDTLLYGIAPECPDDATLDASDPIRAAKSAVSEWHSAGDDDALKRQILDGAKHEFARRGYDATTIRDVVEASGVRMGSIYRRVSSMEAIFDELAENYATHMHRSVTAVLDAQSDSAAATLDALAYVIVQAKRHFPDETKMMSLGWYLAQDGQPTFALRYREQSAKRMARLVEILTQGITQGTLASTCDPATLAPYLRNILWINFPDQGRVSVKQEHRFLRTHLLRGIVSQ
ncbi:TetR/AcrR family transcriptional regulator [Rhodococcus sp. P1Y]|uniref:TetR/AcrR family transcriptional regulator n=1 Tax=Rhodococcus sp. P1Y TaxID=1302308 RepID=UPI001293F16E|nr:TetR/AcrR family transcriptional regulator [Rhodococcus sp. P1Y]